MTNNMPIIRLSNGLKVANFSSAHPFIFEDGSKLPGCSDERCNLLSLTAEEVVRRSRCDRYNDIQLRYRMSDIVAEALLWADANDNVDIVIVPLPVLEAIKESHMFIAGHKFRTCRVKDRVTKICHIDRFCY